MLTYDRDAIRGGHTAGPARRRKRKSKAIRYRISNEEAVRQRGIRPATTRTRGAYWSALFARM